MLRAYQSPYSAADCGPQCAQIPNLASRYQSGICHCRSDSRVPLNGPETISRFEFAGPVASTCAEDLRDKRSAGAPAISGKALRLLIFMLTFLIVYRIRFRDSPWFRGCGWEAASSTVSGALRRRSPISRVQFTEYRRIRQQRSGQTYATHITSQR